MVSADKGQVDCMLDTLLLVCIWKVLRGRLHDEDALPVLPRQGFTYDPNAPVAVATLLTRTFTSFLQSWAPPQSSCS